MKSKRKSQASYSGWIFICLTDFLFFFFIFFLFLVQSIQESFYFSF